MRILAVDDDKFILELIRNVLESDTEDYDITEANSVDQAIQLVDDNDYDVIITDICMPEKDGTQLMRHLKQVENNTPIIAITGGLENAVDDYVHTADLFADKTLAKPFSKQGLVDAINELHGQAKAS